MALINCPECDNEISDKAYSCPYCGYPIHKDDSAHINNKKTNNLESNALIVIPKKLLSIKN